MSKLHITKTDSEVVVFDDVIGHQVGNGAVQVMNRDGTQYIYNNFQEVFIDLDDEEKAAFQATIENAEAKAAVIVAANDEEAKKKAEVVQLNS